MAGPKVTSAKKFKALRALNFFALTVLQGHGWGIAGVWLGPSPTNFSTPCPLGGIRVYEPPHINSDIDFLQITLYNFLHYISFLLLFNSLFLTFFDLNVYYLNKS